jgi:hypothetical protein
VGSGGVLSLYRYIAIHIDVPLHCPPTHKWAQQGWASETPGFLLLPGLSPVNRLLKGS